MCFSRLRMPSAMAAVLALMLVFVAPAPALAVEPPPPPVTPASQLPSSVAGHWAQSSAGSVYIESPPIGSALWDEQMAAARAKLTAAGYPDPNAMKTAGTVTDPVKALKPPVAPGTPRAILTAPGVIKRLGPNGTALAVTGSYLVGWGIGQAGLEMYAATTGTDLDAGMCNATGGGTGLEWLRTVHAVANFGMGPNCVEPVLTPNQDQPITYGSVGYGGYSASYKGTFDLGEAGGGPYYCYSVTGTLAYPYTARTPNANGPTSGPGPNHVNWATQCTTLGGTKHVVAALPYAPDPTRSTSPGVSIINQQTQEVMARMTETRANPSRVPGCQISWSDGTTTVQAGEAYTETVGLPISAIDDDCRTAYNSKAGAGPGGVMPTRIKTTSTAPGEAPVVTSDQYVAPRTAEQDAALATASTAGLVLTLTVDGVTDSCMTWAADCSGWWAETENGTVATHGTRTYTCSFGGAAVSLNECYVYKTTFETRTATPTITDPVTGTVRDWTADTPGVDNSTDPSTGPTPGEACMTEWASAPNPIEWVLHPVKCALVWAFVPRQSYVDGKVQELEDMWEATGVGITVNAITGWSFAVPTSGCSGVNVPMSTIFQHGVEDFRLLDACPGTPLEATAQWSYWIVLISAVLWLVASVTRNFGGIFGARGIAQEDDEK